MKSSNINNNEFEQYINNIVPTEIDTIFRNRLVHGEVHDENAFILDGIAPHAGIFSNAMGSRFNF